MNLQFEWIAIFVCAVMGFGIQALWYSPAIFGKEWMRLSGLKQSDAKNPGGPMAIAALSNLVMAFAMAGFMNYFGSRTFVQGALAGAQLWLGFVATVQVVDTAFSMRPWKLWLINAGNWLLIFVLTGGILAVWK
ncbi:MAG: DUF1761 domain-containing protein [candidate division FCPU426 bacterium]